MTILEIRKFSAAIVAMLFAAVAVADPIVITLIDGGDDGGEVGGYSMTDIVDQDDTDPTDTSDDVTCINSPGIEGTASVDGSVGNICFTGQGSKVSDIDVVEDPVRNGDHWWGFPDQGDVFVTNQNWIEILLPPNTRAVSLWVGASFNGLAWIGAYNEHGDYVQTKNFVVGSGNTKGYGVYSSDSCTALTKIIVEPVDWGFGNLSINQDPCVSVPEPGPLVLLLAGLLGIALSRRLSSNA